MIRWAPPWPARPSVRRRLEESPVPAESPAPHGPVGRLLRRVLSPLLGLVVGRAGRAYVTGRTRESALLVAMRLLGAGYAVTLAYWDGGDSPRQIEAEIAGCIAALAGCARAPRVAVKAPQLGFDLDALGRLAAQAREAGVGLVLDSHAPDEAPRTLELARVARDHGAPTGVAVAARWDRSPEDARAAAADGLDVRVVKGQWAEPGRREADPDLRAACDRVLAAVPDGRATIATHDPRLLEQALRRRRLAGMELLFGLPARRALALARRHDVPVRYYVAYGSPTTGFSPGEILRRPRLGRDLATGALTAGANPRRRLAEAVRSAGRPARQAPPAGLPLS